MRYLKYSEGELSFPSLSVIAPILTQENAKTILPEVVGNPLREVEKVVHKHFPERAVKKEKFEAVLDDELKALLEAARKIAGGEKSGAFTERSFKGLHPQKENESRSIRAHATRIKNYRARDDWQTCPFSASVR